VLTQPSRDFVRVGSLSLWHGANFDRRNPLVTSCVSDHSGCGAVRILISLAQPSGHLCVCVSDGSGCGAALILADCLRSW